MTSGTWSPRTSIRELKRPYVNYSDEMLQRDAHLLFLPPQRFCRFCHRLWWPLPSLWRKRSTPLLCFLSRCFWESRLHVLLHGAKRPNQSISLLPCLAQVSEMQGDLSWDFWNKHSWSFLLDPQLGIVRFWGPSCFSSLLPEGETLKEWNQLSHDGNSP